MQAHQAAHAVARRPHGGGQRSDSRLHRLERLPACRAGPGPGLGPAGSVPGALGAFGGPGARVCLSQG